MAFMGLRWPGGHDLGARESMGTCWLATKTAACRKVPARGSPYPAGRAERVRSQHCGARHPCSGVEHLFDWAVMLRREVVHSNESQVLRLPARGRYLAAEVARLAGVSGDQIGQWARHGYIQSSVSDDTPRVYSYQDVAEAMVVHEMVQRGVPHGAIRSAIEHLRVDYGDWPLTEAPLATTEGSRPALVMRLRELDTDIARWGQVLLPDIRHLKEIKDQLRRGGWVVRDLPDLEEIEVDPDRLSGRPTIRDRRVPAEDVALLAAARGGKTVLRDDYELNDRQISDAVRWYSAVSRWAA